MKKKPQQKAMLLLWFAIASREMAVIAVITWQTFSYVIVNFLGVRILHFKTHTGPAAKNCNS